MRRPRSGTQHSPGRVLRRPQRARPAGASELRRRHAAACTARASPCACRCARIRWPERTRHGVRVAELPDGASLHCADARAWDAFALACGRGDGWVVRAQQSWRGVLASLAALVALLAALYVWGVPWAARRRAGADAGQRRPRRRRGRRCARSTSELMQPSELPAAEQQRLRERLRARAGRAAGAARVPAHRIEFRSSRIGPNAFALPGGTIVLTDELVKLVDGDAAVITGVLGARARPCAAPRRHAHAAAGQRDRRAGQRGARRLQHAAGRRAGAARPVGLLARRRARAPMPNRRACCTTPASRRR